MYDNIQDLYKKSQERAYKMQDILDKANDENRFLTASEQKDYDALMEDLKYAKRSIDSVREFEALRAVNSRPVNIEPETWVDTRGRKVEVFDRNSVIPQRAPDGLTLGGFLRSIVTGPITDAEKRALSEGTNSAGGYTVPDHLFRQVIDRLRAKSVLIKAGARVIRLESDVNKIAKVETDPTVYWRAENSEITATDGTFGVVEFNPYTAAILVKASNELLQDSVNLEEALIMSLTKALSTSIDSKGLTGAGSGSNEPKGIKNYSGLATTFTMDTNGKALANFINGWSPLLHVVNRLLNANAAMPTAAIMNPRTLMEHANIMDANYQFISKPEILGNMQMLDTSAVVKTDTQGTASNASAVYVGDFTELMIGVRSDIRITRLPERYAEYYQTGFLCHARVDIAALHEASFARIIGIVPASGATIT